MENNKPPKNTYLEKAFYDEMDFLNNYLIETNKVKILDPELLSDEIRERLGPENIIQNDNPEQPWRYIGKHVTSIYAELPPEEQQDEDDWEPNGHELDYERGPIGGLFFIEATTAPAPNLNGMRVDIMNDDSRYYIRNKKRLLNEQAERQGVTLEVEQLIKKKTGKDVNLSGDLKKRNRGGTKKGNKRETNLVKINQNVERRPHSN